LEQPDSPKNVTTVPQVTDFTDILTISNAIKSFQVRFLFSRFRLKINHLILLINYLEKNGRRT